MTTAGAPPMAALCTLPITQAPCHHTCEATNSPISTGIEWSTLIGTAANTSHFTASFYFTEGREDSASRCPTGLNCLGQREKKRVGNVFI